MPTSYDSMGYAAEQAEIINRHGRMSTAGGQRREGAAAMKTYLSGTLYAEYDPEHSGVWLCKVVPGGDAGDERLLFMSLAMAEDLADRLVGASATGRFHAGLSVPPVSCDPPDPAAGPDVPDSRP